MSYPLAPVERQSVPTTHAGRIPQSEEGGWRERSPRRIIARAAPTGAHGHMYGTRLHPLLILALACGVPATSRAGPITDAERLHADGGRFRDETGRSVALYGVNLFQSHLMWSRRQDLAEAEAALEAISDFGFNAVRMPPSRPPSTSAKGRPARYTCGCTFLVPSGTAYSSMSREKRSSGAKRSSWPWRARMSSCSRGSARCFTGDREGDANRAPTVASGAEGPPQAAREERGVLVDGRQPRNTRNTLKRRR